MSNNTAVKTMSEEIKERVSKMMETMKEKTPTENLQFLTYICLKHLSIEGQAVPGFQEWEWEFDGATQMSEGITVWKDHDRRKSPFLFRWSSLRDITGLDRDKITTWLSLRMSIDKVLSQLKR